MHWYMQRFNLCVLSLASSHIGGASLSLIDA